MIYDEICEVLRHSELGVGYRLLVFEAPKLAAVLQPGQFIHVKVPSLEESALRRPFSVFDVDGTQVRVLYKTVGRGTRALNRVEVGEKVAVLGPLGKGFPTTCKGTALLVGGGYGVAPLYFLAHRLIESGHKKVILFEGGRTAADLLALDDFAALGVDVRIATNDGSNGTKGFVTMPLDVEIASLIAKNEPFELFTCGPDGLLKAVSERALTYGLPGWISIDRHMICGVGACYACIQKTVNGPARCCVDGPVFPARELVWD